jgi:hypothetical protein
MKSSRDVNRRDFGGAAAATVTAAPLHLCSLVYSSRSTAMNANVQAKGEDATAIRSFM